MTRNRKVDPEVLEREYIYDSANPPVSITALAERHGLARSGVADKAMRGNWYKRREEFRQTLGQKVVEAMGDEWVRFETAAREKAMDIALNYMRQYDEKLKAKEVQISTRDFLGVMAMLRTFIGDAVVARTNGEEVLHDPETSELKPDVARRILEAIERGEPRALEALASSGVEGAGED